MVQMGRLACTMQNIGFLTTQFRFDLSLQIYDGKIADYALLRTYMYSLNSTSTGVTSTSRIMFVQFQPASVALTAKYSTRCAVVYRNSGGLGFSSVDSDGDGLYEHNANCSWTIITRPHNIIHLFITYIAIQLDEECKRDFIKVGRKFFVCLI